MHELITKLSLEITAFIITVFIFSLKTDVHASELTIPETSVSVNTVTENDTVATANDVFPEIESGEATENVEHDLNDCYILLFILVIVQLVRWFEYEIRKLCDICLSKKI